MDETQAQNAQASDTQASDARGADLAEPAVELDELYRGALLDAVGAVRRALTEIDRARRQRQYESTELDLAATAAAEEGRRATQEGDAGAAEAALERQRDVLHRIEQIGAELRVLIDFEEKFRRRASFLQSTVDEFRSAKESARAELALAMAKREFDVAESGGGSGGTESGGTESDSRESDSGESDSAEPDARASAPAAPPAGTDEPSAPAES